MAYFPLFIELAGREVLVVGGGKIALRRILTLSEFGCQIRVVSPVVCEDFKMALQGDLRPLAEEGRLLWKEKCYDDTDLLIDSRPPVFVLAAAQEEVNSQVVRDCRERMVPVNNASYKDECDFYFPGIAKKGNLVAGVTASGKNHKKAAELTAALRLFMKEGL